VMRICQCANRIKLWQELPARKCCLVQALPLGSSASSERCSLGAWAAGHPYESERVKQFRRVHLLVRLALCVVRVAWVVPTLSTPAVRRRTTSRLGVEREGRCSQRAGDDRHSLRVGRPGPDSPAVPPGPWGCAARACADPPVRGELRAAGGLGSMRNRRFNLLPQKLPPERPVARRELPHSTAITSQRNRASDPPRDRHLPSFAPGVRSSSPARAKAPGARRRGGARGRALGGAAAAGRGTAAGRARGPSRAT
jgi:hypothetical protein